MDIKPIDAQALPDLVKDKLRQEIINGKFKPGDRLLENDLAKAFQVSRATLRQAFRDLELDGLVKVQPRRGTVVTRMSREDAADICSVRALLEGHAIEEAIIHGHSIDFELLEQILLEMDEAAEKGDLFALVQADLRFHQLICQSGKRKNKRLYDLWGMLNSQIGALIVSTVEVREVELKTVAEHHRLIIDAIKSGNPSAAGQSVRDHYLINWGAGAKND